MSQARANWTQIIGVALTCAVTMVGVTAWLQGQLHSIDRRLLAIEINTTKSWTVYDMERWVASVKDLNPGLKLPPVALGG